MQDIGTTAQIIYGQEDDEIGTMRRWRESSLSKPRPKPAYDKSYRMPLPGVEDED